MNNFITYLENKSIFNQRIILARSLLAFGALLTLSFNDSSEIVNDALLGVPENYNPFFKQYSLFTLFDDKTAKLLSIFFLISVISGYFPKITSILQSWVHLSICNSFIVVDGGDQIASNLAILLIPICLFDSRKNQWDNEKVTLGENKKLVNVFFNTYYFLIILQVAVIYLHAGVGKLNTEDWKNGTSTYYWFTQNIFGAPIFLQKIYNLITLSIFSPIISWLVMFFELGLFACILATNKTIKISFLVLGILFHFAIGFTHGLISFFFSMSGALILYLDSYNITYKFLTKKLILCQVKIANKMKHLHGN